MARGALAFVVVLLVAALVVVLGQLDDGQLSALDMAKVTGIFFFLFHHVGISADVPRVELPQTADSPFAGQVDFSFAVSMAMLLATFLAVWLLYRGGKATAAAGGGGQVARAVHGAKVGVPYAALSLVLAFLPRFELPLPPVAFFPTGEPLEIAPSPVAALLWPLFLGVLFGALGGLSTAEPSTMWRGTESAGVVRGGVRMALYGLALAFVGYLVVVAVNPSVPLPFGPDYWSLVAESGAGGILLVLLTLLVVPNIAVLVLVPAMWGTVGFFGMGTSLPLLSYTSFPRGIQQVPGPGPAPIPTPLPELGTAPAGYFLFLLVPLVATVAGGWWTARRSGAGTGPEGAVAGAAAGVVYALAVLLLAVLAGVGFRFSFSIAGFGQSGTGYLGAGLLGGTLLALLWGVAGGAIGGALAGRGAAPAPAPAEAAAGMWGPPSPPEPARTGEPTGPAGEAPRGEETREEAPGEPPPEERPGETEAAPPPEGPGEEPPPRRERGMWD